MHPVGWKPTARRQCSAGRAIRRSSRTVAGQLQLKSGMHPFRLEAHGQTAVQCRQKEISQQQNSSRAVLTQIGHEPGRLKAQGQTAVQCRQNQNLQLQNSRTVFNSNRVCTRFVWKPRAKQQFSASRAILRSSRTVAGQFQVRGHEPGRLEAQGQTAVQCRQNQNLQLQNSGTVSIQTGYAPVRLEAQGQTAVQCKQGDSSQQQNSSRAVLTQIGHEPSRLEAQGQTAVQCRQNENLQEQNSNGTVSTQLGYAPGRLEAHGQAAVQCRQSDSSQ